MLHQDRTINLISRFSFLLTSPPTREEERERDSQSDCLALLLYPHTFYIPALSICKGYFNYFSLRLLKTTLFDLSQL